MRVTPALLLLVCCALLAVTAVVIGLPALATRRDPPADPRPVLLAAQRSLTAYADRHAGYAGATVDSLALRLPIGMRLWLDIHSATAAAVTVEQPGGERCTLRLGPGHSGQPQCRPAPR